MNKSGFTCRLHAFTEKVQVVTTSDGLPVEFCSHAGAKSEQTGRRGLGLSGLHRVLAALGSMMSRMLVQAALLTAA